jgi:hypothetical protein
MAFQTVAEFAFIYLILNDRDRPGCLSLIGNFGQRTSVTNTANLEIIGKPAVGQWNDITALLPLFVLLLPFFF